MTMTKGRFAVDLQGFRTQCLEIGVPRLVGELIANAFDNKPAKNCWVEISQHGEIIHVKVRDDGSGFKKKEEIYTLFGDSEKRDDPTLRGRFNLADKQFLAVCEDAEVKTNNCHFIFGKGHFEEKRLSKKFEGTEIIGRIREKDTNTKAILEYLNRIAVPEDKTVFLNKAKKESTPILKSFTAKLMTPKTNGKAYTKMRDVLRETEIFLYDTNGEMAWIYEKGIPIRELDDGIRWHVDVQQKVPQVSERNQAGKTPAYLKSVYQVIAENCQDLLSQDDADQTWTNDAWEKADPETSQKLIDLKFGTEDNPHPKLIIRSTTNSQANEQAEEDGYLVIDGRRINKETKDNLEENDQIANAGIMFKTIGLGENTKPVEETETMRVIREFCIEVAEETIGHGISVQFVMAEPDRYADYGNNTLRWNIKTLGKKAFEVYPPSANILGILIHELAHDKYGQHDGTAHLSHDYLHEMQRIAGICFSKGLEHFIKERGHAYIESFIQNNFANEESLTT